MANEWHNSGADCCSPFDKCLLTCCLPCITYGRIHHRVHVDGNLNGWSFCNLDCCAWWCIAHVGCQWILQMMTRSEIRKKYNLKGDGCTDCLCACCCPCCDLMQQEKEAEYQEQQRALQGGVYVQEQPGKVGQMAYN